MSITIKPGFWMLPLAIVWLAALVITWRERHDLEGAGLLFVAPAGVTVLALLTRFLP